MTSDPSLETGRDEVRLIRDDTGVVHERHGWRVIREPPGPRPSAASRRQAGTPRNAGDADSWREPRCRDRKEVVQALQYQLPVLLLAGVSNGRNLINDMGFRRIAIHLQVLTGGQQLRALARRGIETPHDERGAGLRFAATAALAADRGRRCARAAGIDRRSRHRWRQNNCGPANRPARRTCRWYRDP